MRVLVTIAARFDRSPDGRVYAQGPALNYKFFQRYLDVFDEVVVAARVWSLEGLPKCEEPSDGPGVSFINIPPFTGIFDLARSYLKIRNLLKYAVKLCQAYILRVPDSVGTLAWQEIRRLGLPFAVEVVGDPADSLRAGSVHHPLRPIIRLLAIRDLRRQCKDASDSAYVTEHSLQQRYPPGNSFTTNYSSIDLPTLFFVENPRTYKELASRLVHVGTFDAFYKGPDVLVDAISIVYKKGLLLNLAFVGDGRRRPELEERIRAHGLENHITFLGKLPPGDAVVKVLDKSHLFVLPSLQEGLPRAMIEAMARGLPCIGSTAGGIPELLPPEDMVPPGNALALANKIMEVAQDPARMTAMSARNLEVAQAYQGEILHQRRIAFYRHVREVAESGRK